MNHTVASYVTVKSATSASICISIFNGFGVDPDEG